MLTPAVLASLPIVIVCMRVSGVVQRQHKPWTMGPGSGFGSRSGGGGVGPEARFRQPGSLATSDIPRGLPYFPPAGDAGRGINVCGGSPMLSRRSFVRSSLAAAVAASLPAGQAFSAILGPSAKVDRDIDAVTGSGKAVTLTRAMVQELGDSLRGNLLLAGHPAYDEARRVINA